MTILVPSRRGFLGGLIASIAAPAVVHAANLMPISVFKEIRWASNAGMAMGWYRCDGGLLKRADYPELFAMVGKQHGGDGVTTFAVPNFVNYSYIYRDQAGRMAIPAINANAEGYPPGQIIHQMGRPNPRVYADTEIHSSFFSGYQQWPVKDGRQFQPPADMLKRHFYPIKP